MTAFHQFLRYKRGKPFAWFPEEVADARRQADKDPDKRIVGDTAKLKANSFYGKMIEDVARHANTTFTSDERKVDAAMRSPYLEDLECTKNEAYELLQTGMVGGPAIVFCRYHERDVTGIRSHVYPEPKTCKTVLGLDANMLYPSTLMQDFPCGKEKLFKVPTPESTHNLEVLTRGVQNGSLFGFAQVDIEIPEDLFEKFSEMSPLFVVQEIPNDQIPEHMHEYLRATGRKRIPGTRKLCGLMKAKKILLYTPLLKWYLDHGLKVTAFHQFLRYKRGKPFAWFPEEVADARRQADKDPDKRIVGDTAKLKANSFYGKMIEDVARHADTTFTSDERKVDAAMRSPYLEDLECTKNEAYELLQTGMVGGPAIVFAGITSGM